MIAIGGFASKKVNSMEATDDLMDDLGIDWGSLADELFGDNSSDDTLTMDLEYLDQQNINMPTSNINVANIEGDSVNMGFMQSQYGVNYNEMPTMSNLIPSNSTATLPRSGQSLPPVPKFASNPIAQSSQSIGTTNLPQYNPLQPLQGPQNQSLRQQVFKHKAVQQPQTSSLNQSNNMFGHQENNLHHQMPNPVANIQTGHLHNQQVPRQQINTSQLQQQHQRMVQPMQNFQQNLNQSQLHTQQLAGTPRNLISEGGAHRFQGMVIGEGRNNRQVQQQRSSIAYDLSAPVGFRTPGEFSNPAAWREYAFSQINLMKDRYFNDLLTMQNNARQFHIRATTVEMANKYRNVEGFLSKLIAFLNTPTVDMIPKHDERVYNYMTFIVNYIIKYHNKNRESSQYLEQANQQPVNHLPINQSRGPQLQATGDIRLQQNPQSNIPQVTTNLEANMVNFNQNFPSRKPQQARLMSNSVNDASFQMGRIEQRPPLPPRIGSFRAPQPANVLTTSVNNPGSPMCLSKSTTAVNFPSRPLTLQPTSSHTKFNLEKLKQPMQNTESKVGQAMSPLGSRCMNQFHSPQFSMPSAAKPVIQHATSSQSSQHSVLSRQVNVNTVLSPESIARSPFLHASSTTPSNHVKQWSSSLPPLSTEEIQKSETLIIPCQIRDPKDIKNQVHDVDAPRTPDTLPIGAPKTPNNLPMDAHGTPKSSPMDAPCAEKIQEPKENPHHPLLKVMKSMSSNTWSSASSMTEICSDEGVFDIIDAYEPGNYVASYLQDQADFMLEYDFDQEGIINSTPVATGPVTLISPNIEDKSGFPLEHQNEPERNVRRKLNVTSTNGSLLQFSDHDKVVCLEPKIDSIEASMNKGSKIKIEALLDEVEGINRKLLETSLNVLIDSVKDIHGDQEGIIVRCFYRNVCFPELFGPVNDSASSTARPEFIIDLLVQADYPDSFPTIFNSSLNTFSHEEWVKLYETIVSNFKGAIIALPEQPSLEEMARQWESCAQSVITELAKQRGCASFSGKYGRWEDCIISSLGSDDFS